MPVMLSEAEFRKAGYTGNAINFPLSEAAFRAKCKWNGIDPKDAPRVWRYAPNEWCRQFFEQRAKMSVKPTPCPYPITGDDGTAKQCIERGHCGCDEAEKQASVSQSPTPTAHDSGEQGND